MDQGYVFGFFFSSSCFLDCGSIEHLSFVLSKCWIRKLAASKTLAGTKLLVSDADGV